MSTLFQTTIEHVLKSHHLLDTFQMQEDFHVHFDMHTYQPLVIERHGELISVAHYYEQNGDLMADPEVTFVVARNNYVFPISFRQDNLGIDRVYVRWEDGKIYWNLEMQNDLASFCDEWMENIKQQQYGGRLPEKSRPSADSATDNLIHQGDGSHDG